MLLASKRRGQSEQADRPACRLHISAERRLNSRKGKRKGGRGGSHSCKGRFPKLLISWVTINSNSKKNKKKKKKKKRAPACALVPPRLVWEQELAGTRASFALGPLRRHRGIKEFLRKFLTLIPLQTLLTPPWWPRWWVLLRGKRRWQEQPLALIPPHPPRPPPPCLGSATPLPPPLPPVCHLLLPCTP